MKRWRAAAAAVALIAVAAAGCGDSGNGSSDSSSAALPTLPSPSAVAACFQQEGVVSVYQKKEDGVPFVNGLLNGFAVSAEFTGSKAKTERLLEKYEAEEGSELEGFEALEGAAVGVINENGPAGRQVVLNCLEEPGGGRRASPGDQTIARQSAAAI